MNLNALPFITWLLWGVILSGRIFYLKKKGIKLFSENKERSLGKPSLIPFLLVFLCWFFEIIRAAFNISSSVLPGFLTDRLFHHYILQMVGSAFLLLGTIVFTITLKDFGSSLRFGLHTQDQGPLVTSGIFRFSRNPFFLSLESYFTGTAFILPNIFLIAFTLAAIIGIHYFILREERFLIKTYGHKYLEYKQKVRRYL